MTEEDDPGRAYRPIADYALIGDCHTAALVARNGSIDWYCPGRFDAPAALFKLLDAKRGGYFRLAPIGRFSSDRSYRGPTAVLDTTFEISGGKARITDFMPVRRRTRSRHGRDVADANRIVRCAEALVGELELELAFRPTLDFGRQAGETCRADGSGLIARGPHGFFTLASPGFEWSDGASDELRGRIRLEAGQRAWLALSFTRCADQARRCLSMPGDERELERTLEYWRDWAKRCTYHGSYRSAVLRSALTLKLLTYEPTGAVVAAPTTSLPEQVGGVRNWDYRYTWLRDSSLVLYALMTVGYEEEAEDFFEWLERTQHDEREPQIMYTIDGGRELPERVLDGLDGYRHSRPVRIGNAAADQRQLDVYGEVLSAAELYFRRERRLKQRSPLMDRSGRPNEGAWKLLTRLVEAAASKWQEPDRGLWEVRGKPRLFLYSRLRCWAALDRGVRLAENFSLEAPLQRWRDTRDEIRRAILERGFNAKRQAFTQAFDGGALDASALIIPRIGFLPATDPRVQSTVDAIRQELSSDGFVYRYRSSDGLTGGEATFVMCTFWLVDALALGGRIQEARELFERVLGVANDLGLLSEEIDPELHELLGNFPQGFSHMALIGSAVNLAKAERHGAEEQAERESDRAGRARHAARRG